ncbi:MULTISPECIES: RNA polymerase sigma factor [Nocardioides]|uniref:RNA polymerase sigma factor n=1 Tax=Nocardioides vastitatis TaxID=2568655 RepID=A0ABW0Z9V4_9ACTN|nr:sigma-70 family RNA polymerase sigma factor [Nocardioides sp.]
MTRVTSAAPSTPAAEPMAAHPNVVPFRSRIRDRNPSQPTDAELLARCRRRDPEAWDLLVGRYERLVYSVALRNGLSPEDAADVTQGTFVTLIDSLDRIRDEDRLASWLMTVTRRQSWRVRNLSRRHVELESIPEATEDPLADWDTVVTLHDALGQLGGTCRDLLQALYFEAESPSYAEIADRFGRSIGGIGPLRGRCLEKLRDILTEEEER